MSHKFIDCQALGGGGVALGAVKEGFTIARRLALPGGFGNACVDANTHLFGTDFEMETGEAELWEPVHGAAYLNGTPPCSGFSVINNNGGPNSRGVDSPINSCQRKLVEYAARCTGEDGRRGPEVVMFESVRQAYSQGRSLMTTYLKILRERTGEDYKLYHLLHSDASLNGCQARARYFWCAARVPFRVFVPPQVQPPTYHEVIGDLMGLEHTWAPQPRRNLPSDWAMQHADTDIITAHQWNESPSWRHVQMTLWDDGWRIGEDVERVLARYHAGHGTVPKGSEALWERLVLEQFFGRVRRVDGDKRGLWVLTGMCGGGFLHYAERRGITVREFARMMSLPDSFSFTWTSSVTKAASVIAKNCPLTAGRWAARLAMAAIENVEPEGWEEYELVPDGEHESTVDFTHRWKQTVYAEADAA